MSKRKAIVIGTIALPVLILIIVLVLDAFWVMRTEEHWLCATTGSRKTINRWCYSDDVSEKLELSPLAKWLQTNNAAVDCQWVKVEIQNHHLLAYYYMKADTLPVMDRFPFSLQKEYVAKASREEIAIFLANVRDATPKEREMIIQEAVDRAYK